MSDTAAGKYIVQIGGCNDCHTPGWLQKPGSTPESQWLTGISMGYRGPWGTTYPKNLRLFVQSLTADQFVQTVKQPNFAKPPMPVYDLNHMSDRDLRAIYAYIRSLGPAGKKVPADVPPGQEPKTPYVPFAPPVMPGGAAAPHGG